MGESIEDSVAYLDWMIDYYFQVVLALSHVGFRDGFRSEMSLGVQMMFSKAKSFRQLIDGFSHSSDKVVLKNVTDHTVLFTLVRSAYEQMCAFELVCIVPDTEEKKLIMENVYIASGLVNRHKMSNTTETENHRVKYEMERNTIYDCKSLIHATKLYESLTPKEKDLFNDKVFTKGEYQIVFKDGKCMTHVGWDDVRKYIGLETDALHGMYKYACNMAHPSYLSLIQYKDGFDNQTMLEMRDTAATQLIAIMSVYLCDFLKTFPEVKYVYDDLDQDSKELATLYCDAFRRGNRSSE